MINLDLEISRNEYEDLIRDLIDQTSDKVREALSEAHLSAEDIGRIILVGGSTRTPMVQNVLADMFARPIQHLIDPDLCVGLGAASSTRIDHRGTVGPYPAGRNGPFSGGEDH